jgi:hypothetical protein
VKSVALKAGEHRVYNLEVEQEHRFYVGETGVLVHNSYDETPIGEEWVAAKKAAMKDLAWEDALLDPHEAEFYGVAPSARQNHHLVTEQMVTALDEVAFEGGESLRASERLQYLSSRGGHVGYEDWHRVMDRTMVDFIKLKGESLTESTLLEFIHNYYQKPTISWRIPGVDLSWGF